MSSLSRLADPAGAGIKIVSKLACENFSQLASIVGVSMDKDQGQEGDIKSILSQWISEKSQRPSTWRSLLAVLQELNLSDLAQEIEDYMCGKKFYLEVYACTQQGS